MANYTVFGTGTPAYSVTSYSDGSPSITLGNYFYTFGASTAGWRCRGGRVYIPNDPALLSVPITIMAWVSTTTPVDLSTTPLKQVTTTTGAASGWVEVTWDTPFTISSGSFVFIGYAFGTPRQAYYLYASSPDGSYVRSVDDVDLVLAEASISTMSPASSRGRFMIGGGSTIDSTAWYGSDIMVDDGPLTLPLAEYAFNESSGTTAADSSGNNYDLTVLSASNFNVGHVGNGLHQVGDGSTYKIVNSTPWLETAHRTVMFWGRRGSEGSDTWSPTVYQIQEDSTSVFGIFLNDNNETLFRVYQGDTDVNITAPESSLGTWNHYALTYDQQQVKAYIDGNLVDSQVATSPINTSDGNLYIFGGDYQQQVIDDLRFFDVALAQNEIQSYCAMTIAPGDTEPPTVPTNLTGNAVYQQVTLDWDDSTDNDAVQNYVVYRSDTSGFTPAPTDQVGGPSTATYTEIAPAGTWYYRVSARDESGNESAPCAEIAVTTTASSKYLFPTGLGWVPGQEFHDPVASGMSFGQICAVSGTADIAGARFYSPAAKAGAGVYLYENGGLVASKAGINLSVGWNELYFDTAFIASPGLDYKIVVFIPGPTVDYTLRPNSWPGTRVDVGPMYTTLSANSFYGNGNINPSTTTNGWYGLDTISAGQDSVIDPSFGATIEEENAKQGALAAEWSISGCGDGGNLGFARQFSSQPGDTVEFSCDGDGTVLDIYRIGYYGGRGWRKVASLTNTATVQPDPDTIPNSNGGITCTNWSVTASWTIPNEALPGLFIGIYRNTAKDNASYIPFVIRDDSRVADIVYKTSDTTWALAYNYYGSRTYPIGGKSLYGSGGPLGDIATRTHAVTYHRPIVTREGIPQTYWLACEAPMIRFLERNGYNVKYVASRDLDVDATVLDNAHIFMSNGHDEYWSEGMRDAVETFRDAGGHVLFFSGNEVFWRTRFEPDRNTMWCYKDTMDGPDTHVGGTPLDPVSWTGTWKDTRWVDRRPENTITGTDFRMNGVNDRDAQLLQAGSYTSHVVWRNSALLSGDITLTGVIGFEADRLLPTQPTNSTATLAACTININGSFADDNGQNYSGNGDLDWGIGSQRYASGAVVVGFGTCQWSWMLDTVHDRGGNYIQPAAQQFTVNLFADLGAQPATLMAGMTAATPMSLDNYGVIPGAGARSGKVKVYDGSQWNAHPAKVWDGTAWQTRKAKGRGASGWIEGEG